MALSYTFQKVLYLLGSLSVLFKLMMVSVVIFNSPVILSWLVEFTTFVAITHSLSQ